MEGAESKVPSMCQVLDCASCVNAASEAKTSIRSAASGPLSWIRNCSSSVPVVHHSSGIMRSGKPAGLFGKALAFSRRIQRLTDSRTPMDTRTSRDSAAVLSARSCAGVPLEVAAASLQQL